MSEVIMEGCKCTCQMASNVAQIIPVTKGNTWLDLGLIVFVVLLVILGLIVGFYKLSKSKDDNEDNDDKGYY